MSALRQHGLVVAIALAARLVLLVQLHDHPLLQPGGGLDTDLYVDLARRVAAGDLVLAPGAYPAAPLYIYVLGLVFALTGGSLLAARILQALLGALAAGLVAATARRWFGERAAAPAGLLAAVCGPLAFNEILLLQSALDPFLTALALWALARALHEDRRGAWRTAGAALGALVLNRPNALPYALLLIPALYWIARGRHRSSSALACATGLLIVLGPVAVRNLAVTGEPILIASHGGLNFYIGNNAEADGTYRSVEGITPSSVSQAADARRVAEAARGRPLSDAGVSDYFYERAWAWIRGAPLDAAWLFAKKLAYAFNAGEVALNYSYAYYREDEPTILRWLVAGPWLLLPLGLAGLLLAAPIGNRRYQVWAAFVPVYAAGVAIFFVSERYRLPLLVPLCAGAGALGARAWTDAAARRWTSLAAPAGAVLLFALLTSWPTGLDDGRSEERTAMAEALIRRGEYVRADALIDRALPDHPQPALLLFRAGRALQAAGRREAAIARYQQALDRNPDRPEPRFFLGQLLLDAKRVDEAIPHLQAAVDAGIRLDVAPFDLARALAASGRRDAAVAALQRLELPPQIDTTSLAAAGRLAEALGSMRLALQHYGRAAARPDASAALLDHYGTLLALSGRPADAIAPLERACALDASSATARLNLAVALLQLGREAEARTRLREALAIRPDYPQARALAERLR